MTPRLIDFFKIIRWKNILIYVLLEILLVTGLIKYQGALKNWLYLTTAVMLLGIFGNIQNNILDYQLDRLKPDFIAFNKEVYHKIMRLSAFLSLTLGIFIAYQTSKYLLVLYLLIIYILLIAYNTYMKKWPLVGNLAVAFTVSLAIYIPSSILQPDILSDTHFQFLLIMAFLSTLIRELIKDMEDQSIDRKFGYQTLPIINLKLSKIIFIILINLIWLIMFSYQDLFQLTTYIILLLIISLLLILSLIKVYQNQYETGTKLIKLLMLIGIFSIFVI